MVDYFERIYKKLNLKQYFRQIPSYQHWIDGTLAMGFLLIAAPFFLFSTNFPQLFFYIVPQAELAPAVGFLHIIFAAGSIAIRRSAPAISLILIWISAFIQMTSLIGPSFAQFATVISLYSATVYGSRTLFWLAGLSVPAGAIVGTLFLVSLNSLGQTPIFAGVTEMVAGGLFFFFAIFLVLASAWLAGSAVRAINRAKLAGHSQQLAQLDTIRIREVARLQHEKASMARDVHDVLGHSLAVIIAHADAAQLTAKSDQAAAERSIATIAATAREALSEVRHVVNQLDQNGAANPGANGNSAPLFAHLPKLYQRITDTGAELSVESSGPESRLPQNYETAIYRVIQELLTNALRHGQKSTKISLLWIWKPNQLNIVVENLISPLPQALLNSGATELSESEKVAKAPGNGLIGARERLKQIDGLLLVSKVAAEGNSGADIFRAVIEIPISNQNFSTKQIQEMSN